MLIVDGFVVRLEFQAIIEIARTPIRDTQIIVIVVIIIIFFSFFFVVVIIIIVIAIVIIIIVVVVLIIFVVAVAAEAIIEKRLCCASGADRLRSRDSSHRSALCTKRRQDETVVELVDAPGLRTGGSGGGSRDETDLDLQLATDLCVGVGRFQGQPKRLCFTPLGKPIFAPRADRKRTLAHVVVSGKTVLVPDDEFERRDDTVGGVELDGATCRFGGVVKSGGGVGKRICRRTKSSTKEHGAWHLPANDTGAGGP